MKWFKNKINQINKRVREIDYAIKMYGYDAWGSNAFGNIETIHKLKKEKNGLLKKKEIYRIFS